MFKFFKIIVSIYIFAISIFIAFATYMISMAMGLGGGVPFLVPTFIYFLSFFIPILGLIVSIKYYKNTKQQFGLLDKFIIITLIITPIVLMIYIFV
jgi:hypothetical protein